MLHNTWPYMYMPAPFRSLNLCKYFCGNLTISVYVRWRGTELRLTLDFCIKTEELSSKVRRLKRKKETKCVLTWPTCGDNK